MNYTDLLQSSAQETGNCTCMGLDPQMAMLPGTGSDRARLNQFFGTLFKRMRQTGTIPAAFKPNIGYWSILDHPREGDFSGSEALVDVLDMLETFFPGVPVILDSKRGDIARSSGNYAKEAFDCWKADAVTVAPYMGGDSVGPFVSFGQEKGVYVLCRTSNPGGKDLQNLTVEGVPLYLVVADKIRQWKAGAVVGATHMGELKDIARYFADQPVPLLVPGVGSQGGSAPEVMAALREVGYDITLVRINSSSGLTHPWKSAPVPEDWVDQCLGALRKLTGETAV